MAKLLGELTRPIQDQCPCGGSVYATPIYKKMRCDTCGFTLYTFDMFVFSSAAETTRHIRKLYNKFKRAKFDPMNQLPAYYR